MHGVHIPEYDTGAYGLFKSFPASGDFCGLPITFANSLDPDQALIWIKTVLHFNGIPDFFLKKLILKNIHIRLKNMQNYPACNELISFLSSCSHKPKRKSNG